MRGNIVPLLHQLRPDTAKKNYRHLVSLYLQGSAAAVSVVTFLVFIGLEFTGFQWIYYLTALPLALALFIIPDIFLIRGHFRPVGEVLRLLDDGRTPTSTETATAIVRALNMPYLSFLRVVLIHGPAATACVPLVLYTGNRLFGTGYQDWQIITFSTIVFFFAAPTHAIFEYFSVTRWMTHLVERLYPLIGTLDRMAQAEVRRVGLKKKLLYLAVAVTSLPLLFLAGSVAFKVTLLINRLGMKAPGEQIMSLLVWVFGVAGVCMLGALIMAILTAAEVSRSAARLASAMNLVEQGDLAVQLQVNSADEYADLFRGFNLMTEGLREEVKLLAISQDLMGELHLDVLLERIISATTDLLDADRSTLYLYEESTKTLWSRVAEGLECREIRIPPDAGIAGAVFTSGKVENIVDAHEDPRFNREIDKRTGYRTRSILALPVVNKAGKRIGVTQVLNKRGGPFTQKDESRLRALTAQIAIALENAKLFDDVLRVQNYNESILRSTSNSMITLDTSGRVVTANAATFQLLKMQPEQVVGCGAEVFFAPPNDWVLGSLANMGATGQSDIVVDAELRYPSAGVVSVNLTSVPLIDANQQRIGSMLILEDISDEKRVKGTMSRYMSKEVVEQLLHSGEGVLAGQVQKVSVLFSDIRDFTTVSESVGARETVSMLNEYFADMVDVIFRHAGVLDKYIGDAIMALFGAPFNGPQDADNAVCTANDMIVTLRLLNQRRREKGLRAIDIGIGVNTGEVVVGSIGSPKRMEYTAIGDGVNLASRLEGACKTYGVGVIFSEFTAREMKQPARSRQLDLMRVKGKVQPVAIYEALDHHTRESFPEMDNVLAAYEKGLHAYRSRDWSQALRHFEQALNHHGSDNPSLLYRGRCQKFVEQPPSDEWDGVWALKEK